MSNAEDKRKTVLITGYDLPHPETVTRSGPQPSSPHYTIRRTFAPPILTNTYLPALPALKCGLRYSTSTTGLAVTCCLLADISLTNNS
jgi:hypothetical protein